MKEGEGVRGGLGSQNGYCEIKLGAVGQAVGGGEGGCKPGSETGETELWGTQRNHKGTQINHWGTQKNRYETQISHCGTQINPCGTLT